MKTPFSSWLSCALILMAAACGYTSKVAVTLAATVKTTTSSANSAGGFAIDNVQVVCQ